MTPFQQIALLMTIPWSLLVVVRFRRSVRVLVTGLLVIGLFTLIALLTDKVTLMDLGLAAPASWMVTIGLALLWTVIMVAFSPVADRLASRWVTQAPDLEVFRGLQQSRAQLVAGIIAAWVLGGLLEELIARAIVLQAVRALLQPAAGEPAGAAIAIVIAALGAGIMHLYQGPKAVLIITQLSILFGILFVISGANLWTVILCHGMYDTVAFIRFANRRSRYAV